MINRKDLWLLVLILVVGTMVAIINPRFLSPINLSNTANLIGLFGIFAVAQAFVIISGGIELSVGSIIALLGVIFVDLVARGTRRSRPRLRRRGAARLPDRLRARLSGRQGRAAAIRRDALRPADLPRRRALLHRDATAGFPFGASFPTLEWLTAGRFYGIPHSLIAFIVITVVMGDRAAPLGVRPLSVRGRQERGSGALQRHPHRRASSSRPMSSAAG